METGNWNYSIFWKESINQIQNSITDQEFQMWFKNMNYIESGEAQIIISVPSSFYKDQVTQRYLSLIEGKLLELSGQKISIEIIIKISNLLLRKKNISFQSQFALLLSREGNISSLIKNIISSALLEEKIMISLIWPPLLWLKIQEKPIIPA